MKLHIQGVWQNTHKVKITNH